MTEARKGSESGLTEIQPHGPSALQAQSYNSVRGFAALVGTQFLGAVIRPAFGQHPEKIFLVCCGLILAGIVMFMLRLRSTGLTLAPVVSE